MSPFVVNQPETGRVFNVGGRICPKPYSPKLSLRNYLLSPLPNPPAKGDYTPNAMKAIFQMYLNDTYGDCVPAAIAKMVGVWTGNASGGRPSIFGDWAIKNAYAAFSNGGYPAQDTGCDEVFALNCWARKGFAPSYGNPHRILSWVAVDAADPREVRAALYLFEGLISGLEMPEAWVSPGPSGNDFVFDAAGHPNPKYGHCMAHFSWDEDSIGCATWGLYGRVTNAALAKYMVPAAGGELYAAISEDIFIRATAKSPGGFNAIQLLADARAIGFVHQT